MEKYYVNRNAQSGGEHEVHKEGCDWMPDTPIYLGILRRLLGGDKKGENLFPDVDGCYWCCNESHKIGY